MQKSLLRNSLLTISLIPDTFSIPGWLFALAATFGAASNTCAWGAKDRGGRADHIYGHG